MENTVIILGAGFSKPYGYPSGEELVTRIINRWKKSSDRQMRRLSEGLSDTGAYSIDRFLSEHQNFLGAGIKAIVKELMLAEAASIEQNVQSTYDIMKLFMNDLRDDDFSKLKIITFNYDRFFEWRMFRKFLFRTKDESSALDLLAKLQITHIHGRMIPFSQLESTQLGEEKDWHVPYGAIPSRNTELSHKQLKSATEYGTKYFQTVFTNDEVPNHKAVSAIKAAKRVFFIGFGFDEKNMQKLGIEAAGIRYDWNSKVVAGTCMHMNAISKNKILYKYSFLQGKLYDVSALDFFSNYYSLTDSNFDQQKDRLSGRNCCEMTAYQDRPDPPHANYISFESKIICCICKKESVVYYNRSDLKSAWSFQVLKS